VHQDYSLGPLFNHSSNGRPASQEVRSGISCDGLSKAFERYIRQRNTLHALISHDIGRNPHCVKRNVHSTCLVENGIKMAFDRFFVQRIYCCYPYIAAGIRNLISELFDRLETAGGEVEPCAFNCKFSSDCASDVTAGAINNSYFIF
jgi:hypothetical protein